MDTKNRKKKWFETWFNSLYYHILYKNRNEDEAKKFIRNIIKYLKLKPKSLILDLGCGRGRHSKHLANLEFNVTGIDLSPSNIQYAKKNENNFLHFFIGDMRKIYFKNKFDAIFNLFTSFGYFDVYSDNFTVFNSVKNQLKNNGLFIFDYLNSNFEKNNLKEQNNLLIDNINFKILKKIVNNRIIKTIEFYHNNQIFKFKEKVHIFDFDTINKELNINNMKIIKVFGSYDLDFFNIDQSSRMIIIAKKLN